MNPAKGLQLSSKPGLGINPELDRWKHIKLITTIFTPKHKVRFQINQGHNNETI